MKNNFTHLMIHCSATPEGMWFDRTDIERWHLQERGWSKVGYSGLFLLDGTLDLLIPFDRDDSISSWEISNGARGWNGRSRHICYIGGLAKNGRTTKDTRTVEQLVALENFVKMHTMLWPKVKLIGHNQVNATKDCPSFDVSQWAQSIGIPSSLIDSNIYYNEKTI
ncbi:N-acetylmuramoyl-L-alanine amidase [Xanthovirga aplysinae]|uniref:N-acetylmuramoyl-L-alanine amidase n=1 Tax=Xanthovirga aplysinae TaxID=2529853 RepID=UPI0012BB8842|nr:N-acetylmuramoyl-L-alanine amidase [Xanthovirga aplysinae]MTI33313.1 lysozyme [Xanthovirga aplysinae]